MYNGNGNGNGNGSNSYTGNGSFAIKPIYLYAAVAVAVVLVLYFVLRFVNTHLVMHFGAFAGVLLLVANLRELFGNSYVQRSSTALLNCLIGGGLIFAWLSQFFGSLLWLPAILLLGIATPLAFSRGSVYSAYAQTARTAMDSMRRVMGR